MGMLLKVTDNCQCNVPLSCKYWDRT